MNKIKLKKSKVPGGQKNITSFFSSQNHNTTEPQIKPGQTSTFGPQSPLKRSVLGDLENLLPSSPDLLLSVPETPNSQIRQISSSSSDPGRLSPVPSRTGTDLEKLGQLSPICRSPRSKGQIVRRVKIEEETKTKRQEGCSSSLKRLFSPPPESHNAKRPRTSNSPAQITPLTPIATNMKVTKPVIGNLKTPLFTSNQSEGRQKNQQEEDVKSCNNSGFTLISEQKVSELKANENPQTRLGKDDHSLTAQPGTQTFTAAAKINSNGKKTDFNKIEDESDLKSKGAVRTAVTSSNGDRDKVTSSGQERREGMTSACPDEELDESWFADQMDHTEGPVRGTEDKSKKHHKVPDHVILSGGLNNRYWVLDIEERPGSKSLSITCSKSLHPTETCVLKDGWEMTPVCRGDVVHLEGRCDAGSWLVDREQGFLILLPDSLISGTSISSSVRCMRRAVLGDLFKSFDGGSKQMLNGTIVHEVFQRAARAKDFSLETLSKLAEQALHSPQHLGDMYSLGVSQEEMKQELHDYLPSLEHWAKDYLNSRTPKAIGLKM